MSISRIGLVAGVLLACGVIPATALARPVWQDARRDAREPVYAGAGANATALPTTTEQLFAPPLSLGDLRQSVFRGVDAAQLDAGDGDAFDPGNAGVYGDLAGSGGHLSPSSRWASGHRGWIRHQHGHGRHIWNEDGSGQGGTGSGVGSNPVPLPGTWLLLVSGLALLTSQRFRPTRAAAFTVR